MLLDTIGASWLGNLLTGRGTIRAGESTIRAGQNLWCCLILWLTLKYKIMIKINLNLIVFIQEIIHLK